MPIQAVENRRLYRQIADQLRTLIQGGEFALGTRLPPERDLAVQLGVSRPSVREALIALEVEGLVEVRMGSGIYVRARETVRHIEAAHGPLEIIRARQLIEGELAAVAAASRDTGLVPDLEEALREMEADIARQLMPIRGDRQFHLRIAQASDNSALLQVATDLFDERNGPLYTALGSHFERVPSWQAALNEHRLVLHAIALREPEQARRAMRGHLHRSHERFSANWLAGEGEPMTAASEVAT